MTLNPLALQRPTQKTKPQLKKPQSHSLPMVTLVDLDGTNPFAEDLDFPVKKGQFVLFVEEGDEDGPSGWGYRPAPANASEQEAIQLANDLTVESKSYEDRYVSVTVYKVLFTN